MKKNICFFLLIFLLVFIPHKVNVLCEDSELVRLSKLAQNVKFSYTYNENTSKFTITVTNTTKDLNIEYINKEKKYNSDKELNFYNLYSGKHTFMIYSKSSTCSGEYLITKYVNLPYYNTLYNSSVCNGIENYKYCQKWNAVNSNREINYRKILEYKNELLKEQNEIVIVQSDENIILKFIREKYVEYYYIMLPTIISI